MKLCYTPEEILALRQDLDGSVGFVPTMGNLHQGHVSLIEQSMAENDKTIVSIFVNPSQFDNPNDFENYPRTLEKDLLVLSDNRVDGCFLPSADSMYVKSSPFTITETLNSLSLEGEHRQGHFSGVLTIVMKLLNLVHPTKAYFGEKDFQQLMLVRNMVESFFMDVEIKGCPTIRESGTKLALSSRNNRLSDEQKQLAVKVAELFHQPGHTLADIEEAIKALAVTIDYLKESFGRRFIAFNVGDVRLIDNYAL